MFIYFRFIVFITTGQMSVSILSLIQLLNYITTVYRSYGAQSKLVVVHIAIRIEVVVVRVSIAFVHVARPEVCISIRRILIDVHSARGQPSPQHCPKIINFFSNLQDILQCHLYFFQT